MSTIAIAPWSPSVAVSTICQRFDITPEDLSGKDRDAWISWARGLLAIELRAHGMSLERIGKKYLGHRDHSCVSYLIAKARSRTEGA